MGYKQAGLICSRCGGRDFEVTDTDRLYSMIRRYRVCRHCGKRLVTYEKSEPVKPKKLPDIPPEN
jgi:transcriptional regulator NrdR family protein